ncbi:DsbA family protein [Amycolatopsis pithecellobii]|uniref:DsbA family protein n=1 Tax=Amycolatopsis pithecellobii TaxID=664692 RepID=UPI001AA0899C|nr:DsbA family protein [Amycolatopsis pithecellobii]
MLEVVEYTDPACPWAWGSEPKFRLLRLVTEPLGARWRRVFGILFDRDDELPPDPDAEAAWYAGFIADISRHTGAPHAEKLAWVARTSWPASMAAKAAEAQGDVLADQVLRRLRETTFVSGRPADDVHSVLSAVACLPGLDVPRLARELPHQEHAVEQDWTETRTPCDEVRHLEAPGPHSGRAKEVNGRLRYALPTLIFRGTQGERVVPGWRPFAEYAGTVEAVTGETLPRVRLTADEALRRYGSLTVLEIELLTGAKKPPNQAVSVPTGNGPLWIDPDLWDAGYGN